MNQNLQFYVCETRIKRAINKFMALNAIVKKIKEGDQYTAFIKAIRMEGKNNVFYEPILNGRECIVWNATSSASKANDTTIMSGLIHFQKNDMSEHLIESSKLLLKQLDYVIAVWTSFDGGGIECLINYNGVTPSNFEKVWHEINDAIGLDFLLVKKEDEQLKLISYDPSIYYNPRATSFTTKHLHPLQAFQIHETSKSERLFGSNFSQVQLDLLHKEYDRIAPEDYNYSDSTFRYETQFHDHVFGDKEWRFFPEGIPFYKSNTYYRVDGDKRIPTMYAQAAVLMILNPLAEEEIFVERMWQINKYQCVHMLRRCEIEYIVKEQYGKMQEGKLKANFRYRKIVYKTHSKLLLEEKRQLNAYAAGRIKVAKTLDSIKNGLSELMELERKIMQKDVINITGLSKRTVITHWNRYKDDVDTYNDIIAYN